jgi:hypothetical protein
MPRPRALRFVLLAACFELVCAGRPALAQPPSMVQAPNFAGETFWTSLAALPPESAAGREWVRPQVYRTYALDLNSIRQFLAGAPLEFTTGLGRPPLVLSLPTPTGELAHFEIVESPVMHPQLEADMLAMGAAIKTFVGQGLTDPTATVRLDYTPAGFHAQVLGAAGNFAIDPTTFGDTVHYAVYDIERLARTPWVCHVVEQPEPVVENPFEDRQTGGTLRRYDLAMAATASFTSYHGGTVAGAQAAIVTVVNRLNQIWERDFATRFQLVANNQNLIYTTANPGPYTDGTLSSMINENQTNINSVIGSANYDVGHVVSGLNLGGLAQLNVNCVNTSKSRGGSGRFPPVSDPFTAQIVAHELGHQFGAGHAFNADDSADGNVCLPNRSSTSAYEPGSGVTIMSYQGLCGPNNNTDPFEPMYNQGSYAQIVGRLTGTTCATTSSTGNNLPNIAALTSFSIPVGTAFTATASATDADGDSLTYSWEQRNLGAAQPLSGAGSGDNGTSPIFRVFAPVTSPTRTFPRLQDVLDGGLSFGEIYPSVARTLTLRLMVRDNRAGFGAVRWADVNYNIVATAGPFSLTNFNTGGTFAPGSAQTVTWNVANTTASPVNTANVRILLSIDGGDTWPYVLAASTPNDGSQSVTLPSNVTTGEGRIRVEAVNNVFFDASNGNFFISCPAPQNVLASDASDCGFVRVTWDAVEGAQTYRILRGTPGGSLAQIASVVAPGLTQYDDTTALPGQQYNYAVRTQGAACATGGGQSGTNPGQRASAAAITGNPAPQTVGQGASASFTVVATGTNLAYQWQRNNVNLPSNPQFAGLGTATLTINNVSTADAGDYRCVVTALCGSPVASSAATLTVTTGPSCDSIDFNNDTGFFDPQDIEAFLSVFSEGPCVPDTATCNDIDFNNDASLFDPCDIASFLLVFAEGPCTPCGD